MKVKTTVARKSKMKPIQRPAPPREQSPGVDLNSYVELREMKRILDALLEPEGQSAGSCEDMSLFAYQKAKAILTYCGLAHAGLHAESSNLIEPVEEFVMQAAILELEIVRFAGARLFDLYAEREQRNGPRAA